MPRRWMRPLGDDVHNERVEETAPSGISSWPLGPRTATPAIECQTVENRA